MRLARTQGAGEHRHAERGLAVDGARGPVEPAVQTRGLEGRREGPAHGRGAYRVHDLAEPLGQALFALGHPEETALERRLVRDESATTPVVGLTHDPVGRGEPAPALAGIVPTVGQKTAEDPVVNVLEAETLRERRARAQVVGSARPEGIVFQKQLDQVRPAHAFVKRVVGSRRGARRSRDLGERQSGVVVPEQADGLAHVRFVAEDALACHARRRAFVDRAEVDGLARAPVAEVAEVVRPRAEVRERRLEGASRIIVDQSGIPVDAGEKPVSVEDLGERLFVGESESRFGGGRPHHGEVGAPAPRLQRRTPFDVVDVFGGREIVGQQVGPAPEVDGGAGRDLAALGGGRGTDVDVLDRDGAALVPAVGADVDSMTSGRRARDEILVIDGLPTLRVVGFEVRAGRAEFPAVEEDAEVRARGGRAQRERDLVEVGLKGHVERDAVRRRPGGAVNLDRERDLGFAFEFIRREGIEGGAHRAGGLGG